MLGINNYITILIALSKTKHKGKKIYSTKLLKKVYKKINKLDDITYDLLTYQQSTNANELYREIELLLEQATNMFEGLAEDALNKGECDIKTSNIIYGTVPIIKDCRNVFKAIPTMFVRESNELAKKLEDGFWKSLRIA